MNDELVFLEKLESSLLHREREAEGRLRELEFTLRVYCTLLEEGQIADKNNMVNQAKHHQDGPFELLSYIKMSVYEERISMMDISYDIVDNYKKKQTRYEEMMDEYIDLKTKVGPFQAARVEAGEAGLARGGEERVQGLGEDRPRGGESGGDREHDRHDRRESPADTP